MKTERFQLCAILLLHLFVDVILSTNSTNSTTPGRKGKLGSFFQVIKFPNDPCIGGQNRNGTCYTSGECELKTGVASGTCANGFGVCCIFTLACGKSSSENCTYLVQGSTSATPTPSVCVYTICRCNPNVCRIRLDLNVFQIAGPFVGTTSTGNSPDGSGGSIGDCVTDSFTLSAPENRGSPLICGFNNGQHLYIDASSICAHATFKFGSTAVTRQYDIKVTQYDCQEEAGGPNDCLQYLSSNTGTISSFNFNAPNGVVGAQTTHLSSQCYSICFRRNLNKCAICFWPTVNPTIQNAAIQASFGLSTTQPGSGGSGASSSADTSCSADYLVIPNGFATAVPFLPRQTVPRGSDRFCGRYLNFDFTAPNLSVCTFMRPFKIIFKTDANEQTTAAGTEDVNEESLAPGGIVGFQLTYNQVSC